MSTTFVAESALFAHAQALLPCLRAGERAVVLFFHFLSGLVWARNLGMLPRLDLPLFGVAVRGLSVLETAHSRAWSHVLRDWLSMGLILAASRSAGWFASQPRIYWQEIWLSWDRVLLASLELRWVFANTGLVLPSMLESAYLSLYALPPTCMALLDWNGERNRVHAFLCLLQRTLCAYAPLLDQMDMPRSVFPSGHAAGGFSTAFGIWGAVPERALLWGFVFTLAILVYVAIVYCRYHCAVFGQASILIVGFAYAASRRGGAIA